MTQTRAARHLTVLATLLAALIAAFLTPGRAAAASLQEVTGFGSNPGALRMFRYVPDGLPPGRPVLKQWTDVHGADQTADVSDTVAGYPHQVFRDASGNAVVETYSITGMGHGQPVAPGSGSEQCGSAGAYILDVNLCAAYRLGLNWGLASG
jgi:poly(3-hydroxybutyrate) depolymerase